MKRIVRIDEGSLREMVMKTVRRVMALNEGDGRGETYEIVFHVTPNMYTLSYEDMGVDGNDIAHFYISSVNCPVRWDVIGKDWEFSNECNDCSFAMEGCVPFNSTTGNVENYVRYVIEGEEIDFFIPSRNVPEVCGVTTDTMEGVDDGNKYFTVKWVDIALSKGSADYMNRQMENRHKPYLYGDEAYNF